MTLEVQQVSRVERETAAVAADPTWRDQSVICEFNNRSQRFKVVCVVLVNVS